MQSFSRVNCFQKPLQILKGRYGPYVTDGEVNANIGRDRDPEERAPGASFSALMWRVCGNSLLRNTDRIHGCDSILLLMPAKSMDRRLWLFVMPDILINSPCRLSSTPTTTIFFNLKTGDEETNWYPVIRAKDRPPKPRSMSNTLTRPKPHWP